MIWYPCAYSLPMYQFPTGTICILAHCHSGLGDNWKDQHAVCTLWQAVPDNA